jgi:hypothetical protein
MQTTESALLIPPLPEVKGAIVFDYSDAIAKVSVWFEALSYLDPAGNWGWEHPTLKQWLDRHNFRGKYDLSLVAYQIVDRSLEKAYWRLYAGLLEQSKSVRS